MASILQNNWVIKKVLYFPAQNDCEISQKRHARDLKLNF